MPNETMTDVALFLFKKGRKNCAEAVAGAWQQRSDNGPEVKENLAKCGSGRAPGGLCGAIYAAQLVAAADKKAELTARFAAAAGSLLCREIRSAKTISCVACVEVAASLLEEHLQPVAA
ncbi:MAG: C-GCAxxG-C-C family (seleno)protein [Desulfuromonadaceae bacterium]